MRPYEKTKQPRPVAEPPCQTCRPELLAENQTAFAVFDRCGDDGNPGFAGGHAPVPVAAIRETLDLMEISSPADRLRLLDEVKLISRTVRRELAKERKEDNGEA